MSHVSSFNGLTGNLTSDDLALSTITVATGTTTALMIDVTSDTQKRLIVDGNGKLLWGSGSATGDTNLYRSSANVLKTDDAFEGATTITAGTGFVATTGGVTASAGNIAASAGNVTASGTMTAGTGITATTGNIAASSGNLSASGTVTGGTGVIATTGGVTATAGDITATNGNVLISTIGKGLQVKTGSNARFGTLTLNGATPVVVSNTSVTADTGIFLTTKTAGGTPAFYWVSARSAGVSFSVTGTAGDTSVLNWFLVEPIA